MVVTRILFIQNPTLRAPPPTPHACFAAPGPTVFTIMISCGSPFKIVGLLSNASPPFLFIGFVVHVLLLRVRWRASRKYKSVGKSVEKLRPIHLNSSFSVCISAAVVTNVHYIFRSFPSYETCVETLECSQ